VTLAAAARESPDRVRPLLLLVSLLLGGLAWFAAGRLQFAPDQDSHAGRITIAVTVLTAGCWLLQALPLAAASLLPLVLFPLLGAHGVRATAPAYADPILWLFFGGFVIALATERSGLHRRIALGVIRLCGLAPRRLVLGHLLAAVLVSMWINNTATCLMLVPIGWAAVERFAATGQLDAAATRRLGAGTMLAIGYGASIGGIGTPIGTAPNLTFFKFWHDLEQQGAPPILFVDWLLAFAPVALGFALVAWLLLAFVLFRLPPGRGGAGDAVAAELRAMPPMRAPERRMLVLFVLLLLAWVTRGDVRISATTVLPGWGSALGMHGIDDGTVALAAAIALFVIPSGERDGRALMDWQTARQMPWDILLLLGGGVAIADAFDDNGVSHALGVAMGPVVGGADPLLALALVILFMTFLTEVTSNTAITALALPLLLATARAAEVDPRLLLLPATIAASYGFMLPIGTPPNAVVYATGKVTIGEMARAGLVLNLVSAAFLTLAFWFWVLPWFGVDPDVRPPWFR
jgi:sodium-dependent dicarboxylate transporter 2/3/5